MKYQLVTIVLMLSMAPVVISAQATANTSTHSSPADRAPAVLQPAYSATTEDKPEQINTPSKPIQSLQHPPSSAQANLAKIDSVNPTPLTASSIYPM